MIDYHERPTPTRITAWKIKPRLPEFRKDPLSYHPAMRNSPAKSRPGKKRIYVITNDDGTKEEIEGLEKLADYFGKPTIGAVRSVLKLKTYTGWGIKNIEVMK